MIKIAGLTNEERKDLFHNTASRIGMPPAIVEKDFWVCYMLDYLFRRCQWKDHLVFKGGTSLSKAYHLIQRFSEDIDLILDWRLLGYSASEPWETRSNTQQDKFSKQATQQTIQFLSDNLISTLKADLSREIDSQFDVALEEAPDDPTVNFKYPQSFRSDAILQVIRLEIGALAAWSPSEEMSITPFAAEEYPRVFQTPSTRVRTAVAERTFWEKVTILHCEANRNKDDFPARYSRHYYDLYRMAGSPVKDKALQNPELLKAVVEFKKKFYRRPWAKYDKAVPGTIKLIPQNRYLEALEEDYSKMRQMFYDDVPEMSTIISRLKTLEKELNRLEAES